MTTAKILLLLTSHARLGDTGKATGFWLEELAAPYYEFLSAGADVTLASPQGGKPSWDPKSEREGDAARRFVADPDAMRRLEHTERLDAVRGDFDAIFVAGGHGVMWDLATDPTVARVLGEAAERGTVVAAVCHGPAALVNAKRSNGDPIVKGRRVTGFSNDEERAVQLAETVPFLLESRLRELGGRYEHGGQWKSFAVRDGFLVTGQNPASSVATAREVLAALNMQ